jgi:hypothetical protein
VVSADRRQELYKHYVGINYCPKIDHPFKKYHQLRYCTYSSDKFRKVDASRPVGEGRYAIVMSRQDL